jgi:hypothetical protein
MTLEVIVASHERGEGDPTWDKKNDCMRKFHNSYSHSQVELMNLE